MTKEQFAAWEDRTFGYGYGTGEPAVLESLRAFLDMCHGGSGSAYDYLEVTPVLGESTTWLLINALCHSCMIDYGTSPRYGWLTPAGEALRDFVTAHSLKELCSFVGTPP